MKKIIGLLVLLGLIANASSTELPWDELLPFEEAIVTYKTGGSFVGDKTVYIKDYGRTTISFTNSKIRFFGQEQANKEETFA